MHYGFERTFPLVPAHFEGPMVWQGNDVWQRPDATHWLTDEENHAIHTAINHDRELPTPLEAKQNLEFSTPAITELLTRAQKELEHGCGVFRLRGLAMHGLSVTDCERIFWTMAQQLGTPVSQSAKGERLYHVSDAGFGNKHVKARGPNTRQALSFHTDRCDVIAFFCVRQAQTGGENLLVSAAALHNHLAEHRPDLLEVLYQPFYWQRHNIDTGNQRPWCLLPIFAPFKGKFMANIMRVLIQRGHQNPEIPDLTTVQQEALDVLEQTARLPHMHTQFRQQPGDMLFVNNLVVFHSRNAFEDYQDSAKKRLLLRLWLATPTSRELDPLYAQLYGQAAPGSIRGGIHPPSEA